MEKKCNKCGIIQNEKEFGKHRLHKDGLQTICKSCKKQSDIIYYNNNKEQILKQTKEWSLANKEKSNCSKRKWKKNNPEKVRIMNKNYIKNNPEKVKEAIKTWVNNNPDKMKCYWKKSRIINASKRKMQSKEWRKNNPEKTQTYRNRYINKHRENLNFRKKKSIERLDSSYIKGLLTLGLNLKPSEIPNSLIEAKREQIKLMRLINELSN